MTTLWEILSRFAGLFIWWVIVAPWEKGIRVRLGRNIAPIGPGIHFRIPHLDAVYKQTVRMRITQIQMQTISTRDGKIVTLCATVGYCIGDIVKLYNTLHHPDDTIRNLNSSKIADVVQTRDFPECSPAKIEEIVNRSLDFSQYGLEGANVKIIDFATVRVLRLLQDQRWYNGDCLDTTIASRPVAT